MISLAVGGGIGAIIGWGAHKFYMGTLWETSRKLKRKLSYIKRSR